MSSQSSATYTPSTTRPSTSDAPPPYASSDNYSLVSAKSTSKSVLNKVFNRKSSTSSSSNTETRAEKERAANEAKHAARATYFSTL